VSDYEATQRRRDIAVGIFVIVGMAALGWMVFKFGDLPTAVTRMKSFQVLVKFPTAPGVQKDTPVRFCGYQIGRVTHVMAPRILEDDNTGKSYHQTMVVLSIHKKYVNIPANVAVKLMTRGLGSSYIDIQIDPESLPPAGLDPNDPGTQFLHEGVIVQGSTGISSEFFPEESQKRLNLLVEDLRTLIGNTNSILGDDENRKNIKATLANFTDASAGVTAAMDEAILTMENIRKTADRYAALAATGQNTLRGVDEKADRLVAAIVETSNELGRTIAEMRLAVEKVHSGDGTAGRFINDGRLYENLLEGAGQLNLLLEDFQELLNTISEEGLRSVY
jgi:phospholipid/cholesterol/gamma-HCH transport system substrate-binding protein